ncbi:tripartite tricarboxylate transporter substrate binding protein [Roseococcus pinisoli]|uniref:Tripartite tricarboxylate transporter substrate binding protein n=1 Tax=Roseococcus pinisoli TaxID=2835040 RepID=A0ABS5QHV0_9PROT|nr:tripartite tricarboxylate transporter substrate binding protein [Roseococcus pinisoli]MBS7813286.1 tripartite tricarboxylate transporter substrate binding protein [Roseococcus pinisoli]
MYQATRRGILAAPALLAAGGALAQSFPTREVRMVIPWAAGGGTDILGRRLQPLLAARGVHLVVDNAPGGSSVVGMQRVASSRPDGYTIGLASTSILALMASGTISLRNENFDNLVRVSEDPMLLLVSGNSPWRDLEAYRAAFRDKAGAMSVGVAGTRGTVSHIFSVLMARGLGADYVFSGYPGGARAIADIMGGHIDSVILKPNETMSQIRDGSLRPLATFAPRRLAQFPDLPTFGEAGIDMFPYGPITQMTYLSGPSGMPAAVSARLGEAFRSAVLTPEFQAFAAENGFLADGLAGEDFAKLCDEVQRAMLAVGNNLGVFSAG